MAPIVSKSQRQFWKHDVKVARDYNKTNPPPPPPTLAAENNSTTFTQQMANEYTEENAARINRDLLKNVNQASYQNTWSPMTFRHFSGGNDGEQLSIGDMEKLYLNMAHPMACNNQYVR